MSVEFSLKVKTQVSILIREFFSPFYIDFSLFIGTYDQNSRNQYVLLMNNLDE